MQQLVAVCFYLSSTKQPLVGMHIFLHKALTITETPYY